MKKPPTTTPARHLRIVPRPQGRPSGAQLLCMAALLILTVALALFVGLNAP